MAFLYLAVVLVLIWFLWLRRTKLDIRGPTGLPFVGCYFMMRGKQTHQVFNNWSMKYAGLFKFNLFRKTFVVSSHPDIIHEMLLTRGKVFSARPDFYPMKKLTDGYQNITRANNPALLNTSRKAAHASIKTYGVGRTKLAAILDTAIDDLQKNFAEAQGKRFDPTDAIYEATSLSIFLMLCGKRPSNMAEFAQAVHELDFAALKTASYTLDNLLFDAAPLLRYLPGFQPYRNLVDFLKKRDQMWDRFIWPALKDQREEYAKETVGKAFLSTIGRKYGVGTNAGQYIYTMNNVKLACLDMVMAGTITTSTTFYALLNILQWNPDTQERIYQEIMQQVGEHRGVAIDDKDRLPYSRAVVLEALRYVTVTPIALPHLTREDTQLAGKAVPKGTEVLANLWTLHHDPALWEDPWTFKPERFLDEDGQLLPADHVNRQQFFPFGAGTRVCLGELLAVNRLFLFTTRCVQKFRFSPPDDADPSTCDARNYTFLSVIIPPSYDLMAIPRS